MNFKLLSVFITILLLACSAKQKQTPNFDADKKNIEQRQDTLIKVGAEQIDEYISILKNKKVALMVNQSSLINKTHLVDSLKALGINIKVIFAPEHGFRGNKEAGEQFDSYIDSATGINVISLFGTKKQPDAQDLNDIDIVVYDIQDVGVRFFTYISSMYLLMQSCADNNLPLIILDRPNPNGDYVAGPILDTANYRSFVGMLPIPIVYGLTDGELALMINGEGWLKNGKNCNLTVIKNKNYKHSMHYSLPVKPSPNLPNDASIRLYPSLCFFEATNISIGRGTNYPFQVIGYPDKSFGSFTFTPQDINGMQTNPLHKGKLCYGIDLRNTNLSQKFSLKYVVDFYNICSKAGIEFFTRSKWFDLLMGNSIVQNQIKEGSTNEQIEKKWTTEINDFIKKSQKYMLYE